MSAKTKIVAATAQIIGNETVVTYQGGQDNRRSGSTALLPPFTQADGRQPGDTSDLHSACCDIGAR